VPIEIVGLGEVLWDLLPTRRQLGGAPFNFTFHCHQLGHASVMVSRVGRDEPGDAIRAEVRSRGLDDSFIQLDNTHSTGMVSVELEGGQPHYTIHTDVAYDHLAWDERLVALYSRAHAVCFGTLVQRHPVAVATVTRALSAARNALIIYDVNLRQHFYTAAVIDASLRACRWAKLNDDELKILAPLLNLKGSDESTLTESLRQRYDLELVALTRGANGCLVRTADEEIVERGVPVTVADTIGAGDAFTAGLVCCVLEGKSVSESARFANRLAALVASRPGGTPTVSRQEIGDGATIPDRSVE
jgi:fructokinase